MSLEAMLSNLTREEKLAAMEIIWRDLTADESAYESPAWHKAELEKRLSQPSPEPPLALSDAIKEVKEALAN